MKMARTPRAVRPGDVFEVPVSEGYVLGLAIRVDPRGAMIATFYGPLRSSSGLDLFASQTAPILVAKVGLLGFKDGDWKVIGRPDDWTEDDWPMPTFWRPDVLVPGRGWAVTYDDTNLVGWGNTVPVTEVEGRSLPRDGALGWQAAVAHLGEVLPKV